MFLFSFAIVRLVLCRVNVLSCPSDAPFCLPVKNEILISFAVDSMRAEFLPWAKEFVRMGYTFVGTPGTAEYYCKHDVRKVKHYLC